MKHALLAIAALALGGCATTYQLSLMPRDSGKMYSGTAHEDANGEGPISVSIDGKAYNGTWVTTQPARQHGYISGGFGWGRRGFGSLGAMVTIENPQGGEAKALLTAGDGSGMRCDFKGRGYGRGGGVCKDDRGKEYDVQLRPASKG